VAKDFISLTENPSAVTDFINHSASDRRVLRVLDEKLTRFKEVEELYQEIMKSVHGDKLDADEGIIINQKMKP
jgi:hypothetical protein